MELKQFGSFFISPEHFSAYYLLHTLKTHTVPVKHIYWFAYYNDDEPSVRYRCKYALAHLAAHHNISYQVVVPGYSPQKLWSFVSVYCSVLFRRKPDSLVVYEKIRTNRIYARALRMLLRVSPHRTLYDIDDAEYLKFRPENIYHFMRNCSSCAVGSSALGEVARQMNKQVFALTSPVIDHGLRKGRKNNVLTIGWIGFYNAHRSSLMELFYPALGKLPFDVVLVIMGVTSEVHKAEIEQYFASHPNVTLTIPEDIDWKNEHAVYSMVSTFDLGISPLLDTEMNRAKSAYKLKQYMSCGVPVLGSTLGENSSFLQHGINGFACNNSDDYVQHLTSIHEMSDDSYGALSANALNTAAGFSMAVFCNTLLANT